VTVVFSNISATPTPFVLPPGLYDIDVRATSYGTAVTLQKLLPNGTTYVNALTNFAADGLTTGVYMAGTYQLLITGASGVYLTIATIIQY
jgi:hypothetical protein